MKMRDLNIRTRLFWGFGISIFLTLLIGILGIWGMWRLSNDTSDLYHHPLTVSNAVRDLEAEVLNMQRITRNIIIKQSIHIESEIQALNAHEDQTLAYFDIVFSQFLGDPQIIQQAKDLFLDWKPIVEREIQLIQSGHFTEAADIATVEEESHINQLMDQIHVMIDFASQKADVFYFNSMQTRHRILLFTVLLLLIASCAGLTIAYFTTQTIVTPVTVLRKDMQEIALGDVNQEIAIERKDEIGELAESLAEIQKSLKEKVTMAKQVADGKYDVQVSIQSEKDILSQSLNKMTASLYQFSKENDIGSWVKSGQNELNQCMRGDQDIQSLGKHVITHLATFLEAPIGAIYAVGVENNDQVLSLLSGYAFTKRKDLGHEIRIGEGLVGQAALEKEMISLTEVPENYIRINSSFGEAVPQNIVVVPLVFNDELLGVVELGRFREFSDVELDLLRSMSENIAIGLHTARSRTKTQELLLQTQQQTEELQSQQEELKASNEELEEQTEELRVTSEKLKVQQEELQASNEELEEKTEYLENQRKEINDKNSALEVAKSEIEKKAKDLEISSKYKSEFLANMSHELRTPLNSLLILARDLSENNAGNLEEKQVESAEIIYNSGQSLLNLINEILDLSKIEAGKMTLNIQEIHLSDIAQQMKNTFQHQADEKGLTLKIDIDKNVEDTVHTDPQKMEQILRNLISNAIKFTEKGEVHLHLIQPDDKVSFLNDSLKTSELFGFAVVDTGIGIPENKQKEIFEAFQQGDGSTSRKFGGTGLGLSISRELAKLLGGEIQLQSVPGNGSTFTFYANKRLDQVSNTQIEYRDTIKVEHNNNRIQNDITSQSTVIRNSHTVIPAPSIKDDRDQLQENDRLILIIEDDINFAKTLSRICHDKEFQYLHAGDGETGIHLAEKYHPDAIVLDIKLPGMNGWAVLDTLKMNPKLRHIPVHMMSVEEETMDAFERGAIGYLTKPVNKDDLDTAFQKIHAFHEKTIKEVLVVEDDVNMQKAVVKLIQEEDVQLTAVENGKKALDLLKSKNIDCMILDLTLPDMTGFDVLKAMDKKDDISNPPVIVYTGKELTQDEDFELRKYAESIIIKGVKSEERLVDETALFLHQVVEKLPKQKQKMITMLHDKDTLLNEKKILIVDDDMRNVFALSHILESKNMNVFTAANGEKALDVLKKENDIDVVLMDIMMPVMDGYETMENIRKDRKLNHLPIIALTAKAMKEDREKCIHAGANDYLAKPVDIDRLLSMLRIWLYK